MNWLRSKAKRLSLLALFALALQFGLSFGHFHNDLGLATSVASAAASQSQASTPDGGGDQSHHHDLCAICSSVAMTGSALAADAPPLPLPLTFSNLQTTLDPDTATPDSRRSAFRSRAPPLA